MPPETTGRRAEIADTVIEVLAARGTRGLTHRAVDATAGLPAGSTSYYYRSREALLIAAVRRLAELDLDLGGIATAPPKTVNDLARLLAVLVLDQITTYRARTLARYHLSLEATRYPEVRAVLQDLGSRFTRAAAAMLAQFGSASPALDARAVIAVCAGVEYESIVGGQRPFTMAEIQAVLANVLHARLGNQS
jgi:DNA-binding transcriptional regulator YbjK